MILDIAILANGTVLAGAPSGRQLYAKLVEALPEEPSDPEPLFLDLGKIEVATVSFLRESILAFRTFVRARRSNFYPVIANATSAVVDDLVELVQPRGDVLLTCTLTDDGELLRHGRVGKLDPMQQLTFDLVARLGQTTATKLMEIERGDVKVTAWNNRLASLSNLGMICEQSRGRAKIYSPVFAGGSNGR